MLCSAGDCICHGNRFQHRPTYMIKFKVKPTHIHNHQLLMKSNSSPILIKENNVIASSYSCTELRFLTLSILVGSIQWKANVISFQYCSHMENSLGWSITTVSRWSLFIFLFRNLFITFPHHKS